MELELLMQRRNELDEGCWLEGEQALVCKMKQGPWLREIEAEGNGMRGKKEKERQHKEVQIYRSRDEVAEVKTQGRKRINLKCKQREIKIFQKGENIAAKERSTIQQLTREKWW